MEFGIFGVGDHTADPVTGCKPSESERIKGITRIARTPTTLMTTNDPVRIAEEFATQQHLADGRADLMLGRGNNAEVYPWFGQDIRQGIPWPSKTTPCFGGCGTKRSWTGPGTSGHRCRIHLDPSTAGWQAAVRVAWLDPQLRDRRTGDFGHYQRQLFGGDQAGLPESTVHEMLDLIGASVLPELRAATQPTTAGVASAATSMTSASNSLTDLSSDG